MMKISAPGKLILFGEHAVVYDKMGIATAVNLRTDFEVEKRHDEKIVVDYQILDKFVATTTPEEAQEVLEQVVKLKEEKNYDAIKSLVENGLMNVTKVVLASALSKADCCDGFELKMRTCIPTSGGCGGSAAVAVSIATAPFAISKKWDIEAINESAYWGEVMMHAGTPSGIDNSTSAYGGYIKFKKSEGPSPLKVDTELPIVIGDTGIKAATTTTVANVRTLRERDQQRTDSFLDEIDKISRAGLKAIQANDMNEMGRLMNENQTYLRYIGVSHPSLENLINASLQAGALGAKLTGGGGGGLMYALCYSKDSQQKVAQAIIRAGGKPIVTSIGAEGVRVE